ncbi:hypothetical protein BD779DRAFT_1460905 [Infundibulicybe gibba]|nr:hypothetical protein BD779DRAFT_1460905 [Infundibulicybe gibba]
MLTHWLPDRERFLAEFLRREGRRGHTSGLCSRCSGYSAAYRCVDCEGDNLLCSTCIKEVHSCNGLHRIEAWQKTHFSKTTLKALGYRFQLGHAIGEGCVAPRPAFSDSFVVIDTNGVHEVGLDFCDCESSELPYVQLLRFGWLPATVDNPKTAGTLRVLKYFQLLSFESKVSAYEFYKALARLSDNLGLTRQKNRYRSFLLMIRIYRHLKMLKRAGKGHDPGGSASTQPGECAVLCPACPQANINLPPGWRDVDRDQRYLYRLFLGVDANFRLKRKHVSMDKVDPGLGDGWAYFVGEKDYKDYLKNHSDLIVQAPSTCSNHNAVNAERSTRGLAATGVGTVDCARHDTKFPTSIGDLQKGERYVNMDYIFFSSIRRTDLLEVVVSYDIACQWSVNLWTRMMTYPHTLHTDINRRTSFYFLVPKFHLPAHVKACQSTFSFNYNPHVGRTDGEAPERSWADANLAASSTREMGPGSRRDMLNDHFGHRNWRKTTEIGLSLLRKLSTAIPERNDRKFLHNQFEVGLDPDAVARWKIELEAWEQDHSKPNPYNPRVKRLTQDAVKHQLAIQEANDTKKGTAYVLHDAISAGRLLTMGLDLEEQQFFLDHDYETLGLHPTIEQRGQLQGRSNVLRRKVSAWIAVQHLYIPGLSMIRNQAPDDSSSHQDNERFKSTDLYLPSSIPSHVLCDRRLSEMEWQLRQAQANDALDELRNALRLRSYLYIDKDRFQRGQSANTRSSDVIHCIEVKVSTAAEKYRRARLALLGLGRVLSKLALDIPFLELKANDIRGLSQQDDHLASRGPSEGRRTLSWIWSRLGVISEDDEDRGLQDGLRIEWCKSKARADRWREEAELLQEEMRRVRVFFGHRAYMWDRRLEYVASGRSLGLFSDPETLEGRVAYAQRQAAQFRAMDDHCGKLWTSVDRYVQTGVGTIAPPESLADDNEGDDI